MARCGCSGASCSCMVVGSGAVTVTGTGSVASPYTISASLNLAVLDTPTLDLAITGDGSLASPWVISGAVNLDLNGLTDVDTTGATTGQVLAKQADGTYKFVAATTAPTGAINLSSTGGLQGDGSAGNPLGVKLAPSSGLTLDSTGLKITGAGSAWTAYTPTLQGTTTNPSVGNGSLLGAYSQVGKTVNFSVALITGSTTTRGSGRWTFTLPVTPNTRLQVVPLYLYLPGIGNYVGTAKLDQGKVYSMGFATSTAASIVSHSSPASMPTGTQLVLTGVYEAA